MIHVAACENGINQVWWINKSRLHSSDWKLKREKRPGIEKQHRTKQEEDEGEDDDEEDDDEGDDDDDIVRQLHCEN